MRSFQSPGRSPVYATNGLCATSHPLAAKTAVDILQSGGNAVDAAIAGCAMLTLCEPQMCGLGGDMFALISSPDRDDVVALNASGLSPDALDPEQIRASGHSHMPMDGVASVTMPGAVDGFCLLANDYGRMALAELLAPAIHYANNGVPIAPRVAFDWRNSSTRFNDAARRFFLLADGPPAAGTIFRHPRLGDVFEIIAKEGRDGFYQGAVAEDMISSLRALGGVQTVDDLAATEAIYVDPIEGRYRDATLIEHPPNGQGATAVLLAHILNTFDIHAMHPWGAERAHIEIEASKLAFAERDRVLGDANFVNDLETMLDPAFGAQLSRKIASDRVMPPPKKPVGAPHKDTVYLCVVDRDGMAVSMIYSIFSDFGSGIASSDFGILFQNRGAGFTLERGHANEAGGRKRPLHTIIPAMTKKNGALDTVFGVMGAQYQAVGHLRYLSNCEDYGFDPQMAIDGPRVFCEPGSTEVKVESGYSSEVVGQLRARGHHLVDADVGIGGAQAIRIDRKRGVFEGGSDPRKDGIALGY
ncbi:MAG: gamma-glutamyltransferase family protein [Pseudomonadota bacterium]